MKTPHVSFWPPYVHARMDTHTHIQRHTHTLMHTCTTHNKLIKTCQKEAMQLAEHRGMEDKADGVV